MIKGSCCCGAVQFELAQEPSMLGVCHCARCRKLGANALAFVKRADLTITQGQDMIASYVPEAPYKYTRNFCRSCGSSLGEILSGEDSFPISLHLLDDEISAKIRFHEFTAEKPNWYDICDDADQFEGHPT